MVVLNTNFGDISIELDEENTPNTAKNFLTYVKDGFYDNTIFHRVIDGFMIQGGGFGPDMEEKDNGEPIKNEAKHAGPNVRGAIAMARTNNPHSATAQFFINVKDNNFLNFTAEDAEGFGYCVFGKVAEGMDIVDKIKSVPTDYISGHDDVPKEAVIIHSAKIVEQVA